MLEIKNVTKIYKTKGGADTKALDGVSITFGETGLVFLLGKSGSGKSTLLNIAGGLDEPTSGEVTVKGKSSKNFSGSDFDSYRNTYVGFIFQEYNILDEFNVEDNIALALELQGKPKDRAKIADILEQVELGAYARRKPNTLSGGQKQRIAIARALVKDPQIIMADEPTGALDSATGKQVFDTLKKLSETRLVIVVSHDREFAEIYGDRIVELKDGKIISDVSRSRVEPRKLDDTISVIGENTLSIKKGSKLTKENVRAIENFISQADGDVIISKGEREVAAFRKANRMADDGGVECFEATADSDKKSYSGEEAKFIRSRLPAGKAVKIGASGLKLKPVRLFFTVFLSFIAFTMFGLMSTLMAYDGNSVLASSYAKSDYRNINMTKNYEYVDKSYGNTYYGYRKTLLTPADVERFNAYGTAAGYFSDENRLSNVASSDESFSQYVYYIPRISAFAYAPENVAQKMSFTGTYPAAYDEIMISSYLLDVLKTCSVTEVDGTDGKPVLGSGQFTVGSAEDIIGKYLMLSSGYRKVTGVFDCGTLPAKYDKIKEHEADDKLYYEFTSFLEDGLYLFAFVSEAYYENCKDLKTEYFNYCQTYLSAEYKDFQVLQFGTMSGEAETSLAQWAADYGCDGQLPVHLLGGRTSLADNEIILPLTALSDRMITGSISYKIWSEDQAKDEADRDKDLYKTIDDMLGPLQDNAYVYRLGKIEDNGLYRKATSDEIAAAVKYLIDAAEWLGDVDIKLNSDFADKFDFKVAGYYENVIYNSVGECSCQTGYYFTKNFIEKNIRVVGITDGISKFKPERDAVFDGVCIFYDGSENSARNIFAGVGRDNRNQNDVYYSVDSELYSSVRFVNDMAAQLSLVFLIAGIVFAVFAALLMFNFISMSIASKRKEIGILRAVGARGVDVFKIFFAESGIIVAICTVLSIIGTAVVSAVLNNVIISELGMGVTLFVFGFVSVLMMVGIAVLVAFISTFLPVYLASRKKPVESIRAL